MEEEKEKKKLKNLPNSSDLSAAIQQGIGTGGGWLQGAGGGGGGPSLLLASLPRGKGLASFPELKGFVVSEAAAICSPHLSFPRISQAKIIWGRAIGSSS